MGSLAGCAHGEPVEPCRPSPLPFDRLRVIVARVLMVSLSNHEVQGRGACRNAGAPMLAFPGYGLQPMLKLHAAKCTAAASLRFNEPKLKLSSIVRSRL